MTRSLRNALEPLAYWKRVFARAATDTWADAKKEAAFVALGLTVFSFLGAVFGGWAGWRTWLPAPVLAVLVPLFNLLRAPARIDADQGREIVRLRDEIAWLRKEFDRQEAQRRAAILARLHAEYCLGHDGLTAAMLAGTAPLSKQWVEARLEQLGESWRLESYYPAPVAPPRASSDGTVVTSVHESEGDVLEVFGTVNGIPVHARGWVSAMTNYYEPSDYLPPDEQGNVHRRPDARPREMTDEEGLRYWRELLEEAAPPDAVTAGDAVIR